MINVLLGGCTSASTIVESIKLVINSRYIDFIVHNMTVFVMCANVQGERMRKVEHSLFLCYNVESKKQYLLASMKHLTMGSSKRF